MKKNSSPAGLYIETTIRRDLAEVWRFTQDPAIHGRWDLRFTGISYLDRESEESPQRFLYSTRIGAGFRIEGEGESTGTRAAADGSRTSALRFWSADTKSLIREGSGYWRYEPVPGGTRFFTWYDYRVRFGPLGRLVDRALFRPLLGWATAWSFDRLRLWLERGLAPEAALHFAAVHAAARVAIAAVWVWHGVVPKLLGPHPEELAMLAAAGLPAAAAVPLGLTELAMGLAGLIGWRWRGWFALNMAAMAVSLAVVAATSPSSLRAPFSAATLNLAVIALAWIGCLAARQLPSASHCWRERVQENS